MPVVRLKKLVRVSSEDELHVAANLVSPSVGLQWLCSPDNKAKMCEVVIELAKPSKIKQVEIGNMGSAFVELLVMDNSGHAHNEEGGMTVDERYHSLLPQSMLMSAEESRSGRSLTRSKIFPPDKLSKVALEKKWLYIKIVCLQPFCTTRQYGLRYIKLYSHSPTNEEGASPTATTTPIRAQFTQSPLSVHNPQSSRVSSVLTPSRTTPTSISKTTPKSENSSKTVPSRRRIASTTSNHSDQGEDEFTGLENQSRLLKNTMKHDSTTIKGNAILSRIANERRAKSHKGTEDAAGFDRKKLLVKELPKVASVNFLDSYTSPDASKNVNRFSSYKMSCLDNASEFSEEADHSYRPKRSRKRGSKKEKNTDQWISRKSKKEDIQLPSGFKSLPVDKPEQKSMEEYLLKDKNTDVSYVGESKGATPDVSVVIDPTPDDHVPPQATANGCGIGEVGRVDCPICGQSIPTYFIEVHASECGETTHNDVILC